MQGLMLQQDPNQIYLSLKQMVEAKGLMKTRNVRYTLMALLTLGVLAGAYTLSVLSWWTFAPGVLLFAFFAVQAGFIGHDAAHRGISPSRFVSLIFGQMSMSFVLGMSYHYWWDRHAKHHANPNDEEMDPDIKGMPYAFSDEGARNKRGLNRLLSKYQEYTLLAVVFSVFYFLRIASYGYLIKRKGWQLFDFLFIAGHFALFLALPMHLIGWWQGLLFYGLWSSLAGLYFGLVFLPNHLGMPTIKERMSFLEQQLLTSRDIAASKMKGWWSFFYGGLDYQIEHHLFPAMPRWNLKKAKAIVKEFCKEHGLSYHEEGVGSTYKSILSFSRKLGLSLRSAKFILGHSM